MVGGGGGGGVRQRERDVDVGGILWIKHAMGTMTSTLLVLMNS